MPIRNIIPSLVSLRWFFHRLINVITFRKTMKYSGQLWLGAFKSWEDMEYYLKNSPWSLQKRDELPPFPFLSWETQSRKEIQTKKFGASLTDAELERHGFVIEFSSSISNLSTILDVGAGLNSCYFPICKTKKNAEKVLICDAVELTGVYDYAKTFYSNQSRLNYYDDFPSKKNYDLIYFGSSIHYFFDLDLILKQIGHYLAKNIIFSYSPIALKSDSFFSAPIKNEKILFPNIIHNLSTIKEKAKQYGYQLTYAEKSSTKQLQPYEWMFPRDVYCYDIVLEKISS